MALGVAQKNVVVESKRQSKVVSDNVSHNLNGQKLGRKGRVTRERILTAAIELIDESTDSQISLSAVARRASLGMTSLYLYFADLTELLLALLDPVMEEAEASYIGVLREYWSDDELEERCRDFIEGYYAFWTKYSRILHLRNNMADQYDERMMAARVRFAQPTILLFRKQLAKPGQMMSDSTENMSSVLITGIERAVTVATDPVTPQFIEREFGPRHTNVVVPLSRLTVLAIRDCRGASG